MFASRAFASSSRVAFRNKSSLPQRALQALRDSTKGNDAANKAKGATSALDKKVKFAAPKPVLDTKLGNLKETPVGASSIKVEEVTLPAPVSPPVDKTLETRKSAIETAQIIAQEDQKSQPASVETPLFEAPAMHASFAEFAPRIVVIGVGGAGGNAVNNMIARSLSGVEFLAVNTDAQHLSTTLTDNRLQIGQSVTAGLGCGANPDAGRMAAEESKDEILEKIKDAHMVFITAGMGGGTGTGAASVVADLCYKEGILTVGVVTKPFRFEGTHRMRLANEGVERLKDCVDTMIVIPNQNLFQLVDPKTSLMDSFGLADDVLLAGVKSITDLMTNPGLINLDFADVQSVMSGMGNAMLGTGQSSGEDRAIAAAEQALCNPLLGDMGVKSAKGMLVNITGGKDMTLFEVDAAAQKLIEEVEDENANIIFGSAYDHSLEGSIRVSVVATGIEETNLK
ncbi:hypothetical protein TrLO_g12875 [Triparma laevis f. longispina]|uniref:Cell division protein FtsZ n=2 Tax=Triparma laevis TaxID=1534972 RepID=A0A9W7FR73_9STRA|nr:hypothetical protein TrLO_g12875 [Triparma laevis f. longispina]